MRADASRECAPDGPLREAIHHSPRMVALSTTRIAIVRSNLVEKSEPAYP